MPAGEPLLEPHIAHLDPAVSVIRFGDAPDIDLDLSLRQGVGAAERGGRARVLPGARCRARARGAHRGGGVGAARRGAAAERRRHPHRGLLQRDPLAMRAALADPGPARRPPGGGARRHDGLGPQETLHHREVGEAARDAGVDLLVAVGDRAAAYVAGADGVPSVRIATVEEAIEAVPGLIEPGDVVLIKGSRSMRLERLGAVIAAPEAGAERVPRVLIAAISAATLLMFLGPSIAWLRANGWASSPRPG